MGWGTVFAIPVALLAILGFWLNEPLPPNTANPIKYKIVAGLIKAHCNMAELQAWWTGEDFRLIEQRQVKAIAFAGRFSDPDVKITEEKFAGVPVFVYQPVKSRSGRPGLVYYHGGGFRYGHPAGYESLIFKFVKELDMVVVGVDYRLSPTVKMPLHHEDCEKATQHFFIHAEKYGVNPNMIGAAGDSAGGNLAASISLILRDQGEDQFIFQLLIYPYLQALDMQTPSYLRNTPSVMMQLSSKWMGSYVGSMFGLPQRVWPEFLENKHVAPETWEKYKKYFDIKDLPKESVDPDYKPVRPKEINKALAEFIQDDLTNPYLFPLLADDLSDLPPAYVFSVENDPIRDEAIWYAKRLKRAGNKVMHDHSPDGFHGMIGLQAPPLVFDSAVRATENMITFAKEVLNDLKDIKLEKKKPKGAKMNMGVPKGKEVEEDNLEDQKGEEVKEATVDTSDTKNKKPEATETPKATDGIKKQTDSKPDVKADKKPEKSGAEMGTAKDMPKARDDKLKPDTQASAKKPENSKSKTGKTAKAKDKPKTKGNN